MSSPQAMGKTLAGIDRRLTSVETSLTKIGDATATVRWATSKIVIDDVLKVYTQNIGTAFILGNATNAILGTSALGAGTMGSYSLTETITRPDDLQTTGQELLLDLLTEDSTDYFRYGNVGTGTTTSTRNDTALETEVGSNRIVTSGSRTGKVLTITTVIPSTHTQTAYKEFAILTASSSGTLCTRFNITSITQDGLKNIKFEDALTISEAS